MKSRTDGAPGRQFVSFFLTLNPRVSHATLIMGSPRGGCSVDRFQEGLGLPSTLQNLAHLAPFDAFSLLLPEISWPDFGRRIALTISAFHLDVIHWRSGILRNRLMACVRRGLLTHLKERLFGFKNYRPFHRKNSDF
jgi:hypothetical protein